MRPQVRLGAGLSVVIAVVLVLVGLRIASGRATRDHAASPTTATAAAHTTNALVGRTLLRVAGSGNRSAGRFTTSGPWQLNWSVDCGNELGRMFIVDIQPLGKPASGRQVSLPGPSSRTTRCRRSPGRPEAQGARSWRDATRSR